MEQQNKEAKHPGGRPTKYKPEYCQMIMDYFNIDPWKEEDVIFRGKNFERVEKKKVFNDFPTKEGFADSIGVTTETLREWCKVHPEFSSAFTRAEAKQKNCLIRGAMAEVYSPKFSQFVAINCTDMRDKIEVSGPGGGPIPIEYLVPGSKSDIDIEEK